MQTNREKGAYVRLPVPAPANDMQDGHTRPTDTE